jgi:hypothetical protein
MERNRRERGRRAYKSKPHIGIRVPDCELAHFVDAGLALGIGLVGVGG